MRRLALDLPGTVKLLKLVADAPILRGVPVTIRVPAGQTTAAAPHSLGKGFVGALVLSSTAPAAFSIAPATDAVFVRLTVATAPVSDVTFNVWVY